MGLLVLQILFDPDCIVLSGSLAEFVNTETIEQAVNSEIVTTPTKSLQSNCRKLCRNDQGQPYLPLKKAVYKWENLNLEFSEKV